MRSERLPRRDVGKVDLDGGHVDRREGVTDGVRGVRVRPRIDHDSACPAGSGVNGVDDRALGVVLRRLDGGTERLGLAADGGVDLGERGGPVHRGFARAEQIETRAMDHDDVHRAGVRGGKRLALGKCEAMPDRIVSATSTDGSISVAAAITTDLVRETQQRHDLSPTASAALGRLMTGAALLGAGLKGRGRLSLQVAGDGPLGSLVADVAPLGTAAISARGYAQHPAVDVPLNGRGKFDVGRAVGRGRMQVTLSYEVGQPYLGIVELSSGEIGDDIATYLMRSQQIPSVVALGVLANPLGIKAAGGTIAQVMPGADEAVIAELEERAREMSPVTAQIEAGATPNDLILALAGSLSMRHFHAAEVRFACRCTRERVEVALLGLGREELTRIVDEEPQTEAICEFCRRRYVLSRDEVSELIARLNAI
jgi:molecular chaperone Hsp33